MDTVNLRGKAWLSRRAAWPALFLATAAICMWRPAEALETAEFVVHGLIVVAPLVVPGIVISAWVSASGAGARIARAFDGRLLRTIILASAIGAITPVCGVTVLPLMAGLLSAGVPLAPIMAFWLASPVTDPAMFATTAATLGWGFAAAKSLAAFGLGLFGGWVTAAVPGRSWTEEPLRRNSLVAGLGSGACGAQTFKAAVWSDPARRLLLRRELFAMTRLVLLCLTPAFAAEHLLNQLLQPGAMAAYVGNDAWWAIPLAVFVGAPAYIDGYAALPLTRALMDHGMSPGAAMAFLVSGSVVSIWGAMAIFPVLRIKPFLLFVLLAIVGSLCSGWLYALAV